MFVLSSGKYCLVHLFNVCSQFRTLCFVRMLRRMKSDVLTDSMPTKKWVEVPCALTDSQRELYIDILQKNYSKLNGAIKNGQ